MRSDVVNTVNHIHKINEHVDVEDLKILSNI